MPTQTSHCLPAFQQVRDQTLRLVEGLSAEDCMLQSMPDASPVKWHLAHSSWFFETFILAEASPSAPPFDATFRQLFNSYYVGVGERHPRPERGLLSRPTLQRVLDYRRWVDERITALLRTEALDATLLARLELGLHHEQQHQELILTDIKHHFWRNPLRPVYASAPPSSAGFVPPLRFLPGAEGYARIGHAGSGFAFDNEGPAHGVWLEPFELASRLVSNAEYAAFIADGGYRRPELWLSEGWDVSRREAWQAPLYWSDPGRDGRPETLFTLAGEQPWCAGEPVCHISYYEADAYARWAGVRLPSEAEWEVMALRHAHACPGSLLEDGRLQPRVALGEGFCQLLGDAWEWTQSAYLPYPGFKPTSGVVGEYNGKFMINQMVLRGGSCATPVSHLRCSYRNFFPPSARWQFSGLRLARSCS